MKNLILSTLVLSTILQSCSSGSTGPAPGIGATIPVVSTEWSKVQTNVLLRLKRCINIPNSPISIRLYITKLDSFTMKMEQDNFNKPNCEAAVGAEIFDTTRSIRSITNETANTVDASFKDLKLVHVNSEEMVLAQSQADLYNQNKYCGFSDWSSIGGVYKNINGCYQIVTVGFVSGFSFKFDSTNKSITLPNGDIYE